MSTYQMVYVCSNCGTRYNVQIPFKQEALINLNCPNCGLNCCNPEKKKQDYALDGFVIKNERLMLGDK